jgi:glyoxalase family protein
LKLEIVGHGDAAEPYAWRDASVRPEHAISGFCAVTLSEQGYEKSWRSMGFRKVTEKGNRFRFDVAGGGSGARVDTLCVSEAPPDELLPEAFTVSHGEWRTMSRRSPGVSGVLPSTYTSRQCATATISRSVYFLEPGGVSRELATDPPGSTIDEPVESLGGALELPEWLEAKRSGIEKILPPAQVRKPAEVTDDKRSSS